MLKIMEDEMKIFRAWLQRIVKKDKKLTVYGKPAKAKELASVLGVSEATLTGYHSGRAMPGGDRHYPDIPFDIRKEILKITDTPHSEMMRIGKEELIPPDPDIYKRIEDLEKRNSHHPDNITTIEHAHVKVIQQFQQKELALEINQIMLEIEKNNPALLKVIKSQLSGLANECYPAPQKKRTPGSKKA